MNEIEELRRRLDAAEQEIEIYRTESRVEELHATGGCSVCDHLQIEDLLRLCGIESDRADVAEAKLGQIKILHMAHSHSTDGGKTWTHVCLAGCGTWPCATALEVSPELNTTTEGEK